MCKYSKGNSKKRSGRKNRSVKRKSSKKVIKDSNILIDTIEKRIDGMRKRIRESGVVEPADISKVSSKKMAKGLNDLNKMMTVVFIIAVKSDMNGKDAREALTRLRTPSGRLLIGGRVKKVREDTAGILYNKIRSIDWNGMIGSGMVEHYRISGGSKQRGGFLARLENCYGWLSDMLDSTQTILDTLGMIPPAGFMFDLMSVSMNTLRNKPADALFSFISMVPIAGDIVGKGLKYMKNNPEVAQSMMGAWQMQTLRDLQQKQSAQMQGSPPGI